MQFITNFELLLHKTLVHYFTIHNPVDVAFANEKRVFVVNKAEYIWYIFHIENANDIFRGSNIWCLAQIAFLSCTEPPPLYCQIHTLLILARSICQNCLSFSIFHGPTHMLFLYQIQTLHYYKILLNIVIVRSLFVRVIIVR
jgi:hypothetical protein